MSDYLLLRYRPIANALIAAHGLNVSVAASEALAKAIATAETLTRNEKGSVNTPVPSARRALGHAQALLRYTQNGGREDRIASRCTKLRALLLGNDLLAFGRGVFHLHHNFDDAKFMESLEKGVTPSALALRTEIEFLEKESGNSNWGTLGRPRNFLQYIINAGCGVWRDAGKRFSYRWNPVTNTLSGALADFLRAILERCHAGSRGYAVPYVLRDFDQLKPKAKIGERIQPSDKVIEHAIRAYVDMRKRMTKKQTFPG